MPTKDRKTRDIIKMLTKIQISCIEAIHMIVQITDSPYILSDVSLCSILPFRVQHCNLSQFVLPYGSGLCPAVKVLLFQVNFKVHKL